MWGVPGAPGADLVVIEPGLVPGLLEAFLGVPAAAGNPGQVHQAGPAGTVAGVVGKLGGSLTERRASSQCPRPRSGPVPVRSRAQLNMRGPCDPAPEDSRCHAHGGLRA